VSIDAVATTFGRDLVWSVSIDGGPLLQRDGFAFHVPPHAPGTVDVEAWTESGKVFTARALLTFFDPSAPPDPALFEPVLLPIAFAGGGAFGAQWSTTNTLSTEYRTWFRSPLPCAGCGDSIEAYQPVTLQPGGAAGHLLWAERGSASYLSARSILRETSHGGVTPIPVLRERDGKHGRTSFSDVPRLPNTRATLRVWVLSDDAGINLIIYVGNRLETEVVTAMMTRPAPAGLYFATVDLTAAIEKIGSDVRVSVNPSNYYSFNDRTWSLLSITDNATQQASVFLPD